MNHTVLAYLLIGAITAFCIVRGMGRALSGRNFKGLLLLGLVACGALGLLDREISTELAASEQLHAIARATLNNLPGPQKTPHNLTPVTDRER